MNDKEYMIAGVLVDLLDSLPSDSSDSKEQVAKYRFDEICKKSNIQEYYCQIQVPFGRKFCCDFCIEDELYKLWRHGVHTIGSCCGHGVKQPYIQVLQGESVQKMHELGYEKISVKYGNGENCYKPKTYFHTRFGAQMGGDAE